MATVIIVFALLSATLIILVGLPRDNGTVVPPKDDVPLSYDQPMVTPYLEWQNLEGRWTGLPPYLNTGLDGNISSVGPETSGNLTDGDVGVNGTYFLTALANLTQGSRDALKGASEDVNISVMFWVVGIEASDVNVSDAWVHYRGTDGDLPLIWKPAGNGRMMGMAMNSPLDVSGDNASALEGRMKAWIQFNRTGDYKLSLWVSDMSTLVGNGSSVGDFSQTWKKGISSVKEIEVHVRPSNYSASPRGVDVLVRDDPADYSQPIGGDNVTVEAQQATASMVMALPTTFTISASWKYEDYNSFFGLFTHPCKGAQVELWRMLDPGAYTVVETKFTDDSGRVTFSPVIKGKYAVVVFADDRKTVQVDSGWREGDGIFKWWTGWKDAASNQVWSMRIGGAERAVWAAYDNVRDEASWMKNQVGWNRSHVKVHWSTLTDWSWASASGQIYITRQFSEHIWSRDTLLHEYAHCVMWAAYGYNTNLTGFISGMHTHYSERSEVFAITEGFAEFMACAVDNDPVYPDGSIGSTTFADGRHGSYDEGDFGDWDGAIVEGAVAQVFWDMFDGKDSRDYPSWDPNKIGDNIDRQFSQLWKIMVDYHPNSIKQVWDHWASQDSGLWAIYYHARINMDDSPPTNPDRFTSDRPVGTPSTSNDITVSWTGAADDLSGVSGYSYSWSAIAKELPDEKMDSTVNNIAIKDLDDGRWYIHVRTVDRASNWARDSFDIGPFLVGDATDGDIFTAPVWPIEKVSTTMGGDGVGINVTAGLTDKGMELDWSSIGNTATGDGTVGPYHWVVEVRSPQPLNASDVDMTYEHVTDNRTVSSIVQWTPLDEHTIVGTAISEPHSVGGIMPTSVVTWRPELSGHASFLRAGEFEFVFRLMDSGGRPVSPDSQAYTVLVTSSQATAYFTDPTLSVRDQSGMETSQLSAGVNYTVALNATPTMEARDLVKNGGGTPWNWIMEVSAPGITPSDVGGGFMTPLGAGQLTFVQVDDDTIRAVGPFVPLWKLISPVPEGWYPNVTIQFSMQKAGDYTLTFYLASYDGTGGAGLPASPRVARAVQVSDPPPSLEI